MGLQINDARASAAQAQSEAQTAISWVDRFRRSVAIERRGRRDLHEVPIVAHHPIHSRRREPVHTASTLTNGANNVAAASTGFLDLA